MGPNQRALEVRVGPLEDPTGERLERFLVAQAALAHAAARRSYLAHAVAVLGVPVWLLGVRIGPSVLREVALLLFPVLAFAFLVSAIAEALGRFRLHRLEDELAVRRTTFDGD